MRYELNNQDEQIDNVEENVDNTLNHVDNGDEELVKSWKISNK